MEVRRININGFRVELTDDDYEKLIVISADKSLTAEIVLALVIERGLIECLGDINREDD